MVLVITSSYPRHERDIAGHFVGKWVRWVRTEGSTWRLYSWRGEGSESRKLEEGLEMNVVPYGPRSMEGLFYGSGAPENLEERWWRGLMAGPAMGAMMAAVARGILARRPSALVGHWLVPGGLIARWMGRVFGIPSYVVGHSGGVQMLGRLPGGVGRWLAQTVVEAGPVTVPTRTLKEELGELCEASTVEVAPMGYEPAPQQAVERRERCLGFLGRLVPIKGLGVVLEAVDRLRREGEDVCLEVVGDGPCRQRWEGAAGDGVRFLGVRFGEEKWRYLRSWGAVVAPSQRAPRDRHEGLPVSILEASSVGTVPLVGAVPGVEEWLGEPRFQRVRPADSPRAWAEAMGRWLERDGEAVGALREASRRRVAALAWPDYGQWWRDWMGMGQTGG